MSALLNWNILCWNVRGLNSEPKLLALSNAIASSGCAIICLQETKKPTIDNMLIKSCCRRDLTNLLTYLRMGPREGSSQSGIVPSLLAL